jgi:peptide/nickel transport system permease protein
MRADANPVARGHWRLAFDRLSHDPAALVAAALIVVVVVACFAGAPVFAALLGHGPDAGFPSAVHDFTPVGVWSRVPDASYGGGGGHGATLLVLGADGTVGRDEFLRTLYGGRSTIEVAALATLLAVTIGTMVGTVAGYAGGRADAALIWMIDFALAFPVLLAAIALGATVSDRFSRFTAGGVFLGLFMWPYSARIARVQVLELRERPFIEAARMVGVSGGRILRSHIAPHLAPVMIPPATIMFATTMLLEASLSMLGVGMDPNTASWGGMLATQIGWLTNLASGDSISLSSRLVVIPSVAVLITAAATAMLGERFRKALDPADR